ncbi:MAG: MerR family transcriptional regulator [Curvibacter sp.]|nr:MerR family transcriptional regulator [Curvibacter sp.]
MKIGELARRSGLTPSRIRFYEASGLIQGVARQENGYRDYGPQTLKTLEIIIGAQNAGFALEDIRSLLPSSQGHWQHQELLASLERRLADIEALQQRLVATRAQLLLAIDSVRNRPEEMDCSDRAQWVLAQLKAHEAPGSDLPPPQPDAPAPR